MPGGGLETRGGGSRHRRIPIPARNFLRSSSLGFPADFGKGWVQKTDGAISIAAIVRRGKDDERW